MSEDRPLEAASEAPSVPSFPPVEPTATGAASSGRDLRDPQALGQFYLKVREAKVPIDVAVHMPAPRYVSPDTIGRYGRPGDHEPHWETIQIK